MAKQSSMKSQSPIVEDYFLGSFHFEFEELELEVKETLEWHRHCAQGLQDWARSLL